MCSFYIGCCILKKNEIGFFFVLYQSISAFIADLDDEEPVKQIFIPNVVRLDCSGNNVSVLHIDMHRHCSAPYLYHAPLVKRFLDEPCHEVAGQFDSDGSDIAGDEANNQGGSS